MTQVIYADVLFIINSYINYALLVLTELISGVKASRLRIALAALLGGLYSLIILIPHITDAVIGFSRLPFAVILIFVAFNVRHIKMFLRLFGSFFLTNFIFAGLMLALWYFVSPQNMYLNSFIVYFDIQPIALIVLTAVCYFVIKSINSFVKVKEPKNTIFTVKLHINDKVISFPALYDTGNKLFDPFTGKAVIIVSAHALKDIFPDEKHIYEYALMSGIAIRYIPCTVLGGESLLPCFTAERVQIKGLEISLDAAQAVIAVSEGKIKGGGFSALLPSGIFENITSETGADYDENCKTIAKLKK